MPRLYNQVYQPYTYEDFIKPMQDSTAAHQAQEQAFEQLMMDADKMRAFLKEDWQSYKDYEKYVNGLRQAAGDLATNGLT